VFKNIINGSMTILLMTKMNTSFTFCQYVFLISNLLQLVHSGCIPYDAPVEVAIIRISPRRLLRTQNQNDWVIW